MNKQQGMALILVLWLLSLLMIMAGSFTLTMRRESTLAASLKNNAKATAIAESGLAIAEFMLQNPDVNKRWRADGSIYEIDFGHARLRIRLLAESGKININNAQPEVLQALLNQAPSGNQVKLPSITINRSAAIIDWRDTDDLLQFDGAEKPQYENAGLNYSPRNQSFHSLEEVQMVLGMDEAILKWLEPLITVYSSASQVDLQVASKEVLQVIPEIDKNVIDSYVTERLESAKNDLPPPPLIVNAVAQTASLSQEIDALTIISEVQLNDQSSALINAVVKRTDGIQTMPFNILRWQRIIANNKSLFSDEMNEFVVKQYIETEFDD